MKPTKSTRSMTSFKSTKSIRTIGESVKGDAGEFIDLGKILPTVCAKLQCPYIIKVKKEQQQDEFFKLIKYGDPTPRQRKRLSIIPPTAAPVSHSSEAKPDDSKSAEAETSEDANTLTITALYDTYNCLTEILLYEIKVPRILMQVIALLAPYFQNITTLTVKRCYIDYYTVHEISKILELSTITIINLDNSPILEHMYETLLSEKSSLRSLSLSKCKLNDDDCLQLANKLHHGAPAENLQLLNLSSNHITDVGAKYIGGALRSNRRLRYLNLADNRINDEGASHLFGVLIEFPLTQDEVFNMRVRYMKFLKRKQALYLKYLTENSSFDELSLASRKSAKKKKSARKEKDSFRRYSDEDAKDRAESLVNEILGQFTDPFDPKSLKYRDNHYYCVGNMVLCYINLSYNNLSFLTIRKLRNVLMYQNISKTTSQSGLIKVVIDGNNLPMCKELILLNELFSRNIKHIPGKIESKRRRSRIM